MNNRYNIDMISMFFGANNFRSLGNKTWLKDDVKVKIVSGHKFLITNTDNKKKHPHIATLLIPKDEEKMRILFKEFIGMTIR